MLSSLGRHESKCSKRLPIALADVSEAVARNERLANEVAANALNMHPKYMLPLFPAPNSARVSFEIFGELFAGNDKGFGVDAAAQDVHGYGGVR